MAEKLTTSTFIARAAAIHNNKYGYDNTVYTSVNQKLSISCPIHGEFMQAASSHLNGRGCYKCGREAAKQTCLVNWGTETPFQSQQIQDKVTATVYNTYGVRSTALLPGVAEKRKSTNRDRYGVEFPLQSDEIRSKTVDTLEKKFGERLPGLSPIIRESITATNRHRYGGNSPFCSTVVQQKAIDEIERRYGKKNFHQLDINIQELVDNRDWLATEHLTKSLTEIGRELGISDSTVGKYCRLHNISLIRHNISTGEREVGEFLTVNGVVHTQSNRTLIAPYELDIYIPTHKIAIEYCGLYWHSERFRDRTYHANKLTWCNEQGITLLTIFEDEWINSRYAVEHKILYMLKRSQLPRAMARNCMIQVVPTTIARDFLQLNHIQGYCKGKVLGLYDNETLVAVAVFQRTGGDWILSRYATAHIVPGGLSRLLTQFCKTHEWNSIISFADLRWSEGTLYERTGWNMDKIIPPDYYWTDGNTRWHKSNFRHAQLAKKLPDYDPTKTETENCHAAGLLKLYDCGKIRYTFTKSAS